MIFDRIENWRKYFSAGVAEKLQPAFDFINGLDITSEVKKYELSGDDMFCPVSEYVTLPEANAKVEYHGEYIDIQVLISGEEYIGWSALCETPETVAFDSGCDVGFHAYEADKVSLLRLRPGYFAMLLPGEGHAPCIASGAPAPVKKAVIKIRKSLLEE